MMRVAMLSVHTSPVSRPGAPGAGGMNTYVRELSRYLGRTGTEVDIFTRHAGEDVVDAEWLAEGVRVIPIEAGPKNHVPKSDVFDLLPEFVAGVEEYRQRHSCSYDIVHSHYWLGGWVGDQLGDLWRAPHVTMFHTIAAAKNTNWAGDDDDAPERCDVERMIISLADAIVVASPHERALVQHLGIETDQRVQLIPCGVDLGTFRPIAKEQARAKLGIDAHRVALFVGRVVPLKGIDILLDAVSRLVSLPDMQVVIAGGPGEQGHELKRLRWLVEELEMGQRVRFEGPITWESLPIYYSAADVCVVPSHYESFGLVAMESLACGTPVIASKVGGLPSVVKDGRNGFLVPWRCPQEFADRIAAVLTDDLLLEQLCRRARPSVLRFGWQNIATQISALYDSVLGGRLAAILPN